MTLDEAIKHAEEVAEEQEKSCEVYGSLKKHQSGLYERLTAENNEKKCAECAAEHRQLAEWLTELKEAKRLLKAAVEDANAEAEFLCAFCKHNDLVDGCPYIESYSECEYKWRYTDEALKLIGDEDDGRVDTE